jgi:tryptophan synthase alpha chain
LHKIIERAYPKVKFLIENELKKNNKKAFGIFLTAGDPDFKTSLNLIKKLPENGVDFIEIGMPFSDPMADGPSIQLSSQRALKSGTNLTKCLSLVEKVRL